MEAEVFESMGETIRRDWTVEESEQRLKLFAGRVSQRGLAQLEDTRQLTLRQSHAALETFLEMNSLILNIKKVNSALSGKNVPYPSSDALVCDSSFNWRMWKQRGRY